MFLFFFFFKKKISASIQDISANGYSERPLKTKPLYPILYNCKRRETWNDRAKKPIAALCTQIVILRCASFQGECMSLTLTIQFTWHKRCDCADTEWPLNAKTGMHIHIHIRSEAKFKIVFFRHLFTFIFYLNWKYRFIEVVYFKWIFQKHNFVSLAAHTYGKRECQSRPPNSFSDATKCGISDFKWLTLSVTFGRPMLATMLSPFGKYFTAKPPSSCTDLLSAGRLWIWGRKKNERKLQLLDFGNFVISWKCTLHTHYG